MSNTIAYSDSSKGWTSFFSYVPENILGMNGSLYSFKNGNLYKHNSNEVRNNFYGVQYNSKVAGVFNVEPNSVKNFNTFSTDNDTPWSCTFYTDLSKGTIDKSQFVEKEGGYFAYIRSASNSNDLRLRSVHGIGIPVSVVSTVPTAVVVTFLNDIGSIISTRSPLVDGGTGGSEIYAGAVSSGAVASTRFIGTVVSRTAKSVTIDTTTFIVVDGVNVYGSIPLVTDMVLYSKNLEAESYGLRGYYMQFELENDSTSRIQLYNVQSNIFKSNP
jgi:hypothetical protein